MFQLAKAVVLFVLLTVVSSCGGSGGGGGGPGPSVVTASAGADIGAVERTTVRLSGSGFDSEGSPVTFLWTQISGPAVTLSSTISRDPTFEAPDVTIGEPAEIVLRLTVSNDRNSSAQDDVSVTVRASDFLVFQAAKDSLDSYELYKYDVGQDTTTKLSGPMVFGGNVFAFSISPDGRSVAYQADQDTDGNLELYVVSSDGSGWLKVSGGLSTTVGNRAGFEWAPNGASLLFFAESELFVVNADGSGLMRVNEPFGPSGGFFSEARWSPDSRYIAYVGRYTAEIISESEFRLYVHDTNSPNGVDQNVLAGLAGVEAVNLVHWSPDSSRLAYLVAPEGTLDSNLIVSSLDGAAPLSLSLVAHWHKWSPDSEYLVFEEDLDRDLAGDLIVARRDGSSRIPLNNDQETRGSILDFRWSPDSSQVAFSVRDGDTSPTRLYVARSDGTSATRISHYRTATSDSRSFAWSPGGSRIAFRERADLDGAFDAIVASADGGEVHVVSEPAADADGVTFGFSADLWSPDSSHFSWRAAIDSSGTYGLYAADVDNLLTNLVTPRPPEVAGQLQSFGRWSSDSSALAYTSQQDSATKTELYISNVDGSMNIRVSGSMIEQGRVADNFSWSP